MKLTRYIADVKDLLTHPNRIIKNIVWRFPKQPSDQRHIFVVGAPRSGTSLLKLILDAHPNLSSPGFETGIFLFKDIYKHRNLQKLFQLSEVDVIEDMLNHSANIVDFFDNFAKELLKEYGGNCFVEKTPSHVLHLKFLTNYFPNSYFINIIRDGRDCYCSARNHPNVTQARNIKSYAQYWRKCVNSRLDLGNHSNIFDLRYEELVLEPQKVVKSMMSFLGEEYCQKQLEPHLYSRNPKKNNTREFKKLSQPIDSSSIGRYKNELSNTEIKEFNQIAQKELLLLDYKL